VCAPGMDESRARGQETHRETSAKRLQFILVRAPSRSPSLHPVSSATPPQASTDGPTTLSPFPQRQFVEIIGEDYQRWSRTQKKTSP
jgi:hypothetical protein